MQSLPQGALAAGRVRREAAGQSSSIGGQRRAYPVDDAFQEAGGTGGCTLPAVCSDTGWHREIPPGETCTKTHTFQEAKENKGESPQSETDNGECVMGAMLRLKDEAALAELLKKGNLREATMISGKTRLAMQPGQSTVIVKAANQQPKEKVGSDIEELLASQIRLVKNLPEPIREYHHLRGSKHRLDFAWPEYRVNGMQLGIEVQGMVHRIKHNFSADIEKRARGQLQGWLVLEVGGEQIRSGKAMEWLQELFKRATREE